MKKILLIVLIAVYFSVLLGSNQAAYAIGGTISDGPSCVAIGGTWDGVSKCTISSLIINSGETLTISSGITLVNTGTINNYEGTIRNFGSIDNSGTIYSSGSIFNSGSIANNGGITNFGIIDNSNTIDNNSGGGIINPGNIINSGIINNNSGADIFNKDYVTNNPGTIYNSGTLNNLGTLTNTGSISSTISGTIINSGTINNSGTLDNSGIFFGTIISCSDIPLITSEIIIHCTAISCGPNTFESGNQCLPVSSLAFCGAGTIQVGNQCLPVSNGGFDCGAKTMEVAGICVPDLSQICGDGTFAQNLMCLATSTGQVVGGYLIDINSASLFVAAIGVNPLITGLVGITIAGVAGQAAWFVHRRRSENS